ncbi:hypothetical protein RFI_09996 [Reticulomyxa filosa]|uniref:Cyclin C-terminal domain-containing protein n=1 Tax=Reticulomyxa filosa TaxID=46433 RepID=X6NP37_RETFI|nr:hypothetical protein RFI_09996 [Reticulomyxa filosa]|eukprot:ETO27137.1 hypothetical protein RFI_09996 [Reticulomyxa filosa]
MKSWEHWKAVQGSLAEKSDIPQTQDIRLVYMTRYLCEMSLYEPFFYDFKHSHVGIACVYTAFYLSERALTQEIQSKLCYDQSKLLPLMRRLIQIARTPHNNPEGKLFNQKNQTYIKYSSPSFAEVSKLPLVRTSILQKETPQ